MSNFFAQAKFKKRDERSQSYNRDKASLRVVADGVAISNKTKRLKHMDIVIEILIEIYMELMFLIIPEEKRNKKALFLTKLIAVLCTLGIIALGVWGIILLADSHNLWGIAPLSIAIVLSIVQIVFGIVLHIRRIKK